MLLLIDIHICIRIKEANVLKSSIFHVINISLNHRPSSHTKSQHGGTGHYPISRRLMPGRGRGLYPMSVSIPRDLISG